MVRILKGGGKRVGVLRAPLLTIIGEDPNRLVANGIARDHAELRRQRREARPCRRVVEERQLRRARRRAVLVVHAGADRDVGVFVAVDDVRPVLRAGCLAPTVVKEIGAPSPSDAGQRVPGSHAACVAFRVARAANISGGRGFPGAAGRHAGRAAAERFALEALLCASTKAGCALLVARVAVAVCVLVPRTFAFAVCICNFVPRAPLDALAGGKDVLATFSTADTIRGCRAKASLNAALVRASNADAIVAHARLTVAGARRVWRFVLRARCSASAVVEGNVLARHALRREWASARGRLVAFSVALDALLVNQNGV